MKKIIRQDYNIVVKDNMLIMQNTKIPEVMFPITRAEAIYLALHDGTSEEEKIDQIVQYIFSTDVSHLEKAVSRFLVPINDSQNTYNIGFGCQKPY